MTTENSSPAAPVAPLRPHVWQRPTGDVPDPWAWMRDVDDPDFLAHVAAENEHTSAWFGTRRDLVTTLYDEIRSRVQETDLAVPVPYGDWWYVTRTEEGADYPIHHRGPTREAATEETVLDENQEATGHEFFALGAFDVSADHRLLAWSADTTGDEHCTLRVRDLVTGGDLADTIPDTSAAGVAWSHDARWLLYVRADAQERPHEVWRHRLGSDPSGDELVHREDDERFHLTLGVTRSHEWIVMHAASSTTTEIALLPTTDPTGEPTVVRPRRDDVDDSIDHWGDSFVLLTNDDATDFRVLVGDGDDPATLRWRELEAHRPGRRIVALDAFADHLLLHEWADAQPQLRVLGRDGSGHTLNPDAAPHDVEPAANPDWSAGALRFRTQSLTQPPSEWETTWADGVPTLLRRTPTPNVDLDAYVSRREWATSHDGTRVPLDVVHHRDTPMDGTAPGVVYGYGAYEVSLSPWFSVARLSLLDRGWVWALAHPRGGGELGRRWYLDGKLDAKPNSFADMEACADLLTSTGVIAADRLAIRGASAGGLLVGACAVRRPDRYAAVVAEVPFVDVVNTMNDHTLPLTAIEREEWGDPGDPDVARLIERYAPYDNTSTAWYPATYVTGGLHDPRVGAHEPAKWVARLRAHQEGDAPILLHMETGAGHGGPSGRYDAWRDEARVLAFLLTTV